MKRVVVTGLGLLTSIGLNYKDSWNNLLIGKSGIRKITHFDTNDLSCKIAGHLIDNEIFKITNFLENREIKRNDRFIQYGLIASEMAIPKLPGLFGSSDKSFLPKSVKSEGLG